MTATIHVVDDDADHRTALADLLDAAGFGVVAFASADLVLDALPTAMPPPDLIVSDLRMPGRDGLALLAELTAQGRRVPVILITGHGDVTHAVQAMQAGAVDFLEKPYDAGHLILVIQRALRASAATAEVARLQDMIVTAYDAAFLGKGRALTAARARIAALAALDVDVVITGETGTGKELAARSLHQTGGRAGGPFVAINCAAIPEGMFESLMFGQAAGAFDGVGPARTGKIEAAHGGTLLLDEVESLPLAHQAKLLRVLQERSVERLGETQPRPVSVRVISTTKVDLRDARDAGLFRADLFFRLNGAQLDLPPLRETGDDIVLLFAHFAQLAARQYGRADPDLPYGLRRHLLQQAWPGNVRELKAAAGAHALDLLDAMPGTGGALSETTLADRVANFEAREIAAALDRFRGNTLRTAEKLGLPRRTLNDKMRRYGLISSGDPSD